MGEIYVSTDVEADGPIPGPHSMLSVGSAAFTADKQLVGTFEVNLEWLDGLPGVPIFVGYPAGFDFTFVRYYLERFAGRCPFGFAALDVKSFAMAILGTEFRKTAKRFMPRDWFDQKQHSHRALEDAIEQGQLFCNMLAARDAALRLRGDGSVG
jgi:DNA polymerase III epsilon subunit-like protein